MANEYTDYYDIGLGGGRNTLEGKKFWEAADEHRLIVQQCQDCDEHVYPPQDHCAYCWSGDLEWDEVSGEGTVHTFSTVHIGIHSAWEDEVPYIMAFIELEEGPILLSTLMDCEEDDVEIGTPVEVTFRGVPEEDGDFPLFAPVDE